jgi:hypothetical protein
MIPIVFVKDVSQFVLAIQNILIVFDALHQLDKLGVLVELLRNERSQKRVPFQALLFRVSIHVEVAD